MDLGPSACLSLGGVRIVVASNKVQMADQEMFPALPAWIPRAPRSWW